MRLRVMPIESERWTSAEVELAVEQIRNAARRIQKGLNTRQERKRFTLGCEKLEAIAFQERSSFISLGKETATAFYEILPREGTVTLPFINSEDLHGLEASLPHHLREAAGWAGGFVVMADLSFDDSQPVSEVMTTYSWEKPEVVNSGLSYHQHPLERTRSQILDSIHRDIPFGWLNVESATTAASGLPRHEILVKVLREFIICGPGTPGPANLNVAFKDGSISSPFPLFRLPLITRPERLPVLRAGLMSGRHTEMDSIVDLYLLRNSEMRWSEEGSIADQEKLAFEKVKGFLNSVFSEKPGLELHLYLTGLEPASLGNFRAIMEFLLSEDTRGRLVVIPRIFRGNEFLDLMAWF